MTVGLHVSGQVDVDKGSDLQVMFRSESHTQRGFLINLSVCDPHRNPVNRPCTRCVSDSSYHLSHFVTVGITQEYFKRVCCYYIVGVSELRKYQIAYYARSFVGIETVSDHNGAINRVQVER